MTSSDFELKMELAKLLPDMITIEIINLPFSVYDFQTAAFIWKDTCMDITDREWDFVVNEIINRHERLNDGFILKSWQVKAHEYLIKIYPEYKKKHDETIQKEFDKAFKKVFSKSKKRSEKSN
jgi:hypothetical protein